MFYSQLKSFIPVINWACIIFSLTVCNGKSPLKTRLAVYYKCCIASEKRTIDFDHVQACIAMKTVFCKHYFTVPYFPLVRNARLGSRPIHLEAAVVTYSVFG